MFGRIVAVALASAIVLLVAAALASGGVVLGTPLGDDPRYVCRVEPGICGWGTAAPRYLTLGGVPSGVIRKIRWTRWGRPTATGVGESWTYTPKGGYYAQPVRVELRAFAVGRCAPRGSLAYRRLVVRKQVRPGGQFGRWGAFRNGFNWICGEGRRRG
jgi:hypothetical protein